MLQPVLCSGLGQGSGSWVLIPNPFSNSTLSDKVNYLTLKHPVTDTLWNGLCLSYHTYDK